MMQRHLPVWMLSILTLALVCAGAPTTAAPLLDRTRIPEAGPPREVELPPIQTFQLPNGVTVALVERHGLPLFAVQVLVRGAGTASDPPTRAGLASLTANMLDEGAGARDVRTLALDVEMLGAQLGAWTGPDAAVVGASGLTRVMDPLLDIVADVVLRPSFTAGDFDRVKGEVSASILREQDSGPVMARLLFNQFLFAGHPYGARPNGTVESLSRIDLDAVRRFHSQHYVPQQTVIVVVGDVTRQEIEPRLARVFGPWRSPEEPRTRELGNPSPRSSVSLTVFDRPAAEQSSIVVGLVGVRRNHEDYIPLQVMNAIFGGLFNSRLNLNLREQKHWSYGARSGLDARTVPGPFIAAAEVQTNHTAEALAEIIREIHRMRDEPVSEEELHAAKRSLIQSLPQRFETVTGTANAVVEVMQYDLPLVYWDTFADRVEAVSAQQVLEMARTYLDAKGLTIVVAGDQTQVMEPLKALKLVPNVRVVDAQGRPI